MFDLLSAKKGDLFTDGLEIYLFVEATVDGISAESCGTVFNNEWRSHTWHAPELIPYDRAIKMENFHPMSREQWNELKIL